MGATNGAYSLGLIVWGSRLDRTSSGAGLIMDVYKRASRGGVRRTEEDLWEIHIHLNIYKF